MKFNLKKFALLCVLLTVSMSGFATEADPELLALQERVKVMNDKLAVYESAAKAPTESIADRALEKKAPSSGAVKTSAGQLTVGGLVQVWYYSIQNDNRGLFDNNGSAGTGIVDSNAASDNDSFRIRRAELRFGIDIHENVRAFVMIDPANEANSFPQLGVGQKRLANVSPEYAAVNGTQGVVPGASTNVISSVQRGSGTTPRVLQDALINFHDICFLPHHDFTVGQMLPTFNEENIANNGKLDFAERSYIGNSVSRDMGAVLHGSWICSGGGGAYQGLGDTGRVQYWLGVYNGSADLFGTNGSSANRGDTNNNKDFVGTLMVRPVWDDCAGNLELGYSFRAGHHGNAGSGSAIGGTNFIGLNSSSLGHDGWMKYYAPGCFKGLWLKGEAMWLRDRTAPGSVIDQIAPDFQGGDGAGNSVGGAQFSTFGYWGAVGYKFADSPFFNCSCHNWVKNFEADFRYEVAPNVLVGDPQDSGRPDGRSRTNVYRSTIYTAGVNYYIKGDNAKLQLNYNLVKNPDGPASQPFHNTRNNSLVLSFQVMW